MTQWNDSKTEIASPTLELEYEGTVQSFSLEDKVLSLGRNPTCQLVVNPHWGVISGFQAVLRQEGMDYRIYDGNGDQPSTNGILLNNSRIPLQEGLLLRHGIQLAIGANLRDQVLLKYHNPLSRQTAQTPPAQVVQLAASAVAIGRHADNQIVLPSPLVSRHHAIVESTAQGHQIRDLGSINGIFVDGQKVDQVALQPGSIIQIGAYSLVYQGNSLRLANTEGGLRLDACQLTRIVRVQGKPRCILDAVSLPIEPGQLVALVGGSGAGKSTLMKTLLGLDETTQGLVYLNGYPLRAHYNLYRMQLGYVPQDDIIHRELTVEEVLRYAAQLRLSADLDASELHSIIAATLSDIEMEPFKHNSVSTLSGGQRKRVSIGVELLANPKLFFLDEPTSGLDPGLDKKMMLLLRKLADAGRTIVLVTHATANITLCDRVAFMGRGGKLCYYGLPAEAARFFELSTPDFADIYNELEQGIDGIAQWQQRFLQSPYYQRYVTQRLSITEPSLSKLSSQSSSKPSSSKPGSSLESSHPSRPPKPIAGRFSVRQCWLLMQRYFQLLRRDRVNLMLALLTAPIGVALMAVTVGRKALTGAPPSAAPLALQVLFIFTCAAIWVGLSSSLQEIVREMPIYLRERLVNLRLIPYLASKTIVLAGLAIAQTLLTVVVILVGFDAPTSSIAIEGITLNWTVGVTITTFLTLLANIGLGLAISAFVKNAAQANSALPLLLLPQIILSGVLFNLGDQMKVFSWLMLSRWSVGAYGTLANVNALGWFPGTATKPAYAATADNLLLNWGLLLVHTIVYLGIALLLQKRKDPIA